MKLSTILVTIIFTNCSYVLHYNTCRIDEHNRDTEVTSAQFNETYDS